MSDTRTLSAIAAALALGASAFADVLTSAEKNAIPVNAHTTNGLIATFAADASEFAQLVSATPAGTDQALTDRVTHLETLMAEGGTWFPPAAPAPADAPAAPAVQAEPTNAPPAL